jgi:hypothetical protein
LGSQPGQGRGAVGVRLDQVVGQQPSGLHPGHLDDLGQDAPAVGAQAELADQVDGLGDHVGHDPIREGFFGHLGVGVQLGQGLAGRVGVDGAHGALMAGVHGIEHVEGFGAADLPDDDPGWSHAQGLADQLADADLADAFQVGEAALQPDAVLQVALQGELFGFLDGDDPLPWRDLAGNRVQGGGLARPGPPRDEQVEAGPHRRLQQPGNVGGEGAQGQQVLDGVGQEAVAADGQAGEGGQGWADGVQAAAVGQAGVGFGVGLIQPASGHRDGAGRERP